MATWTNAGRSYLANGLGDNLDLGYILFAKSDHNEVAKVYFAAAAFPAAVNGVLTAAPMTADTSAAGGIVTHAHIHHADNTDLCLLTTVVGSGDIDMTSLTIGAGDTVSINDSGTITVPAS